MKRAETLFRHRPRNAAIMTGVAESTLPPPTRARAPEQRFGTAEFDEEYQAAVSGFSRRRRRTSAVVGTLSWLVERYRETVN